MERNGMAIEGNVEEEENGLLNTVLIAIWDKM